MTDEQEALFSLLLGIDRKIVRALQWVGEIICAT
jgi:hypothetical protein